MKTSADLIKKTGITCTEFVVTAITLLAINVILIAPAFKMVNDIFR